MSTSVIDRLCDCNENPCLESSLALVPPPPPRPAWLPQGEALKQLPTAVQFAVEHSLVPLWDEVVVRADTAVERSAGETFVYVAWLEIQQHAELSAGMSPATAAPPVDVAAVLDRLLRVSRFKLAAGSFLMRVSQNWKADNRRRYLESVRDDIEAGLDEMERENDEFRALIERKNRAEKPARVASVETRGTSNSPPAEEGASAGSDSLAELADRPQAPREELADQAPVHDSQPSQLDTMWTQFEDRRQRDDARQIFARESVCVNAARRELEKRESVAQRAATNGRAA